MLILEFPKIYEWKILVPMSLLSWLRCLKLTPPAAVVPEETRKRRLERPPLLVSSPLLAQQPPPRDSSMSVPEVILNFCFAKYVCKYILTDFSISLTKFTFQHNHFFIRFNIGSDNCDVNASCSDLADGYSCACNAGFSGNGFNCADNDECSNGENNCSADANCQNVAGSFKCFCKSGKIQKWTSKKKLKNHRHVCSFNMFKYQKKCDCKNNPKTFWVEI